MIARNGFGIFEKRKAFLMRIFLTGGTGYVGSAVVDALVRARHEIDALVRNSEKAAEVQARGARPVLGDLTAHASWADAAAAADGVVHAAAEYSARGPQVDRAAIDGILALPPREGRFVAYTSGVWVLGPAPTPVDERAPLNPAELVAWRPAHEQRVLDAARAGVRPIVIRPGVVYGGARGIVGELFKDAANGLIRVIGTGENHWPLVYDRDLGDLFARLVASPKASGIYHANDEGDERVNDMVSAIAAHAPIRPDVRHVPLAEARQKMGAYADALALDQIVRSPRALALGWRPTLHSVSGNAARLFEEWRRGREAPVNR
jgi:nucleoside-diphosphate-sugar epimerase